MKVIGVKTKIYKTIQELLQSYDKKARLIIYDDGSSIIEVNTETNDNNISDWQADRHFQNIEELQKEFVQQILVYE